MVDFQAVLLLDFLQDNVNPLDSEDSPFLAYKNMAVHASGLDMLKAVRNVFLQFGNYDLKENCHTGRSARYDSVLV